MPESTKKPADEAAGSLSAALLKLQKKPLLAKQSGTNPHFQRKYSTLDDVWAAARDQVNELGLVVTQFTQRESEDWVLVTEITHAGSGEKLRSGTPIVWGDEKGRSIMQSLGSAITYARRYGLVTALGIIVEDDDANDAGSRANAPAASRPVSKVPATEPQKKLVTDLLDEKQINVEAEKLIRAKIAEGKLTKSDASVAIEKMQAAPKKSSAEAAANDQAEADAAAGAAENEAEAEAKAQEEHDTALDDIPF